jgi:hypothetical protein
MYWPFTSVIALVVFELTVSTAVTIAPGNGVWLKRTIPWITAPPPTCVCATKVIVRTMELSAKSTPFVLQNNVVTEKRSRNPPHLGESSNQAAGDSGKRIGFGARSTRIETF